MPRPQSRRKPGPTFRPSEWLICGPRLSPGMRFWVRGTRPYEPLRDVAGPEWRGLLSRFIRRLVGEIFDPLDRLALALLVGRHRAVSFRQIASCDVWARYI